MKLSTDAAGQDVWQCLGHARGQGPTSAEASALVLPPPGSTVVAHQTVDEGLPNLEEDEQAPGRGSGDPLGPPEEVEFPRITSQRKGRKGPLSASLNLWEAHPHKGAFVYHVRYPRKNLFNP